MAGNTVIVKPSEVTPLSGEMFCSALASALPDGVLQTVQGDGKVGEQLVSSDDIHMVAMTGSTATGKRIMEVCSKKLKRLVLELGGKDPMIVFKDADIEKAATDAVANSLFNCGQGNLLLCCLLKVPISSYHLTFLLHHTDVFFASLLRRRTRVCGRIHPTRV